MNKGARSRFLILLVCLAAAVHDVGAGRQCGSAGARIRETFSRGLSRWFLQPVGNWQLSVEGGDTVLCLVSPGRLGKVRAPAAWAVLRDLDVSGFVMEGRFRCTASEENPHRDLVVVFHFQDSLHFGYVHFSARSDQVHNIIGLVNGSDRVKVNLEPAGESVARLVDKAWHRFRVQCDPVSGRVEAFLDDLLQPILTAVDTTLRHGSLGVGSFDDTGCFDELNVELLPGAHGARQRAAVREE